MHFAASLVPCAKCGAAPGRLDLHGNDGPCSLIGECPGCGEPLHFHFDCDGDPLDRPHDALELGLAEPSQIIAPHELRAELARLDARITQPPSALAADEWQARCADARRAATAILELCKFGTDGQLEEERDRVLDRLEAFTADAPRVWRLGGKLRLVDEARALMNQVGRKTRPDAASLRRYIAQRGAPMPDADVGAITIGDESRPTIELDVRRGTIDELEAAFARVRRAADRGAFEVKVAGQRLAVTVKLDGKNVRRLTIDFSAGETD